MVHAVGIEPTTFSYETDALPLGNACEHLVWTASGADSWIRTK